MVLALGMVAVTRISALEKMSNASRFTGSTCTTQGGRRSLVETGS